MFPLSSALVAGRSLKVRGQSGLRKWVLGQRELQSEAPCQSNGKGREKKGNRTSLRMGSQSRNKQRRGRNRGETATQGKAGSGFRAYGSSGILSAAGFTVLIPHHSSSLTTVYSCLSTACLWISKTLVPNGIDNHRSPSQGNNYSRGTLSPAWIWP